MRMSIDAENLLSAPLPMRELRESAASSKLHINPSVLVIVIILSVVFLCSGILHILARCLGRRRARQVPGGGGLNGSSPSNNSLRGQLQHLFSLHDSGVEQVFIDTLPVFLYGSIRGLKDSADCAVCLTEFANEDKLRLLPKCKHAFHTECIDTWLLSNSTCPLCRRSLLPDADPIVTTCAPQDEPQQQQATTHGASFRGSFRASLRGSFRFLTETINPAPPSLELIPPTLPTLPTPPMTPGPTVSVPQPDGSEKTLRVELGRVNVDRIDTTTSRMARSYSMGSYEYVVDFARLGLPGSSSSQQPMHRTTLSDGIPELCSAGHTPGQEDLFWASRGLDTPHSLSRVREIMTPSPGWNSSPFASQKQKRNVNLEEEEEEDDDDDDDEGGEIKAVLTRLKKSNSNPNSNTSEEVMESAVGNANVSTSVEIKDALTRLKKANPNPNSNPSVGMVEPAVGNSNVSTSVEVKDALTRLKKGNPNPNLDPSGEMVECAVGNANVSTSVEIKAALTRLKKANPNSNPSVEMVESAVADATHRSVEKQDDDEDEEVLKGKQHLPRDLSVALMRSPVQELGAASRKDKVWEVSVDVSEPERSPSSRKSSPLNWLRGRGRRLVYSAASPSATDLQEQQQPHPQQQQQQSTEVTNT